LLALEKPRGYSQKLAVSVVYFQEKYGKIELRMASERLHKHPTHALKRFFLVGQTALHTSVEQSGSTEVVSSGSDFISHDLCCVFMQSANVEHHPLTFFNGTQQFMVGQHQCGQASAWHLKVEGPRKHVSKSILSASKNISPYTMHLLADTYLCMYYIIIYIYI
jgi:hypothetical protein